ncbi:MAG: type II secretion system inner membrane protein GspF [Bdellovibrionales bacterium]|nr:type II secretion system inner membrane protein GspF [Bdellovibrionales bacterium]
MPVYEYVAINQAGREIKGRIDAENERVARQRLRKDALFPTSVIETASAADSKTQNVLKYLQSDRVSLKELSLTTRQFATLLTAGLPLVSALQVLGEQSESSTMLRVLVLIREQVEEGASLAKALAAHPRIFPRLYTNLVAAGEASGTLDQVLEKLADYLEGQLALRGKLFSAMTYPVVMLIVCFLVIVGLMVGVIPRIVEIFIKQNLQLPLPTQVVISLSNFLIAYWWALIVGAVLIAAALSRYYQQEQGRSQIDKLLLKLPIFGPVYVKVLTARIASTLSALIGSGVELLRALEITKNIIGNVHVVKLLEEAREGVKEGKNLSREILKHKILPTMLSRMIAIGEKSGDLETMLSKAATTYDNEVNSSLQGLTSLLEPLLMVTVGVIVLVIVVSVLLPMTELINAVAI